MMLKYKAKNNIIKSVCCHYNIDYILDKMYSMQFVYNLFAGEVNDQEAEDRTLLDRTVKSLIW